MTKSSYIKLLLITVGITLLVNIFFGRFLTAKISTIPVLNRFHILSPQAPIVINTTHQERISDTNDTVNAVNALKSKLSLVILVKDGQSQVLGGSVNLTSEGLFLTTKQVMGQYPLSSLYVKLDDGTTAPITDQSIDPATNLVVVRAQMNNIPVAVFANSENLVPGQKIVFLSSSVSNFNPHFLQSFVISSQHDIYGPVLSSDSPSRSFNAQNSQELLPGQAISNTNGDIAAIWDGKGLISSDVINNALSIYFSKQSFIRPQYGFYYKPFSPAETQLLKLPLGIQVKKPAAGIDAVVQGSPAAKADIKENDIIQAVGNTQITEDNSLEELLQNYKPGDSVTFKIMRGTQSITVNLTVGQLK
jgi:S1-C subfamily serine protease